MNQIFTMVIRQVTRQFIDRGALAGFYKAGQMGQRRNGVQVDIDALQAQMTQKERHTIRRARQPERQAQQSLKAVSRISKFERKWGLAP